MPKIYIGRNDKARLSKNIYVGDGNNIARMCKKVYVGDENNKARLAYLRAATDLVIYGPYRGSSGKTYTYTFKYDNITYTTGVDGVKNAKGIWEVTIPMKAVTDTLRLEATAPVAYKTPALDITAGQENTLYLMPAGAAFYNGQNITPMGTSSFPESYVQANGSNGYCEYGNGYLTIYSGKAHNGYPSEGYIWTIVPNGAKWMQVKVLAIGNMTGAVGTLEVGSRTRVFHKDEMTADETYALNVKNYDGQVVKIWCSNSDSEYNLSRYLDISEIYFTF